jgi:ParB family chromosome partitioning protein
MALEKIVLISLEKIDRPAKIAREAIDPEKVRELAESIREVGQLQPVVVRSVNGRYEMVAGDRRFLAHKLLGLKEIKAVVKTLNDHETIIVRGIENLQRENLTPSEEALFYLTLKEEGGLSQNEICRKTGKTKETVSRLLWFAKLSEDVRRAVDRKDVSLNVLEILAEVGDETMFRYFFDMASGNGVSSRVARMWIDDHLKTKAGTYYSEGGGDGGAVVLPEIKPSFVTCDCCHEPVETTKVRSVLVCGKCLEKVVKRKNA